MVKKGEKCVDLGQFLKTLDTILRVHNILLYIELKSFFLVLERNQKNLETQGSFLTLNNIVVIFSNKMTRMFSFLPYLDTLHNEIAPHSLI